MCINNRLASHLLMSDNLDHNMRSLSPNTTSPSEITRTCTHKDYGISKRKEEPAKHKGEGKWKDTYTTVCTHCKRVLLPSELSSSPSTPPPRLPSTLSIRLSRDEEDHWVPSEDLYDSDSHPQSSLSHGLCHACFSDLYADLTIAPALGPPRNSRVISKSTTSPHLTRALPPPPAPPRVLVVDDNRLLRQIHKRMVEQEGFACDVASSGASAIDMAKKGNYCLVLLDLVMSPLDGWTTSKTIRTCHSGTSKRPSIVAVTGMRVDERLKKECADAGMDDAVQKPISQTSLSKLLSKHSQALPDR
eukprot:Phypoly_transcript_09684.p1 GENE.Phypoly_transcript_09684~~Phypoly_transcript_09684.p1  ORF type:complete len:303 (-),score=66.23 Phypoly_transcript_09684:286-1194(-)